MIPNQSKSIKWLGISASTSVLVGVVSSASLAQTLPPPEEPPEEILRTEVITAARSPVDGQRLTAAEYAELQAQLRSTDAVKPKVSPKIQRLILLLRVRKVIKSIAPFLVP